MCRDEARGVRYDLATVNVKYESPFILLGEPLRPCLPLPTLSYTSFVLSLTLGEAG